MSEVLFEEMLATKTTAVTWAINAAWNITWNTWYFISIHCVFLSFLEETHMDFIYGDVVETLW